jgi:hypothetical protein
VWITAELDAATARAAEWASGGTADALIVADNSGETIGSVRAPLTAGSRVASLAVPPGPLQAGTYTLRLRVVPSGGGSPLTDTVTFAVPTEATGLGSPRLFRRGPTNASPRTLTANPLFRRTEHLRVAVPAAILVDGVEAELLDRTGKAIQVPVKTGTEIEDGITWVSAEIALAPLAPGDYVVRTSASYDNRRQEILTAFRVVP